MKRLLLLTAIFLSGCSTTYTNSRGEEVSQFLDEMSAEGHGVWGTKIVPNYDDMKSMNRAEALNLKTGEKNHWGSYFETMAGSNSQFVIQICEGENYNVWTKSVKGKPKCVISRLGDRIFYKSVDDYYSKVEKAKERDLDLKEKRKAEILASLVDRCMNFGWNDDDQISACVQQESYRDLQLARQKREIASLERRLASATKVEEKPFYLEALEILTEEAKNRENQQMKLDIAKLKGKAGIR